MLIKSDPINIGEILSNAFSYWKRTLQYHVILTALYFSVAFLAFYFAMNQYGLLNDFNNAIQKLGESREAYLEEVKKIASGEGYRKFYWVFIATTTFLYPLNFGLLKIFRKLDLKQPLAIEDLFAGYLGSSFFAYISFYLFWILIYNILAPTILLGIVWVFVTLFCGPLMFFRNLRIFEGIRLSFKALKKFPAEIFVCAFCAVAIRYFGMISIVGALFTFPIWNAIIYAMFSKIFSETENNAEKI